ncbi:MAG: hypothetical protein LAT50_06540 [Ectothiorhodospiraceae bacterium]|nr:hypothetical protein [Ectothiorhodospiraceae bacterium]
MATKVAFLAEPGNHTARTGVVAVIEPHFAHVFLTDHLAYKLKKPQRYPLVDLSSLESRRLACEEEIRLNNELAPGVYLGLSMLTMAEDGSLSLDGAGAPVDYLVRMRRLDQTECLQGQLSGPGPDASEIDLAARRLISYYQSCNRWPASNLEARRQRWQSLSSELDSLMEQRGIADSLRGRLQTWQQDHADLLETRWTIDGHGDLRPEHIYLGPEPVFIDRLEFKPQLRMTDPLEELAFLTMECDRLGSRWVGERFLARYRERTGDAGFAGLSHFYEASRSLLWAVLSARHLVTGMGDAASWKRRARFYLRHGLMCLDGATSG